MERIIGFDRATVFGQALALLVYSIFGVKQPAHIVRNQNRAMKIAELLNHGLAPHPDELAKIVSKMPYEPFGVPGLTNTTKFDGNLADNYQSVNPPTSTRRDEKCQAIDWTNVQGHRK